MDQELKAKWVAALRSGKYEQGRGSMRPGGKYCCLAVLADACDADPFSQVGDFSTLVRMNDGAEEFKGRAQNFAEIADYIEKNL